jgi:hypothetical protein
MVDTLTVQYSTFKRVRVLTGNKHTACVTVDLTSSPIVGAEPATQTYGEDPSVSFTLQNGDRLRFLEALKTRGLVSVYKSAIYQLVANFH